MPNNTNTLTSSSQITSLEIYVNSTEFERIEQIINSLTEEKVLNYIQQQGILSNESRERITLAIINGGLIREKDPLSYETNKEAMGCVFSTGEPVKHVRTTFYKYNDGRNGLIYRCLKDHVDPFWGKIRPLHTQFYQSDSISKQRSMPAMISDNANGVPNGFFSFSVKEITNFNNWTQQPTQTSTSPNSTITHTTSSRKRKNGVSDKPANAVKESNIEDLTKEFRASLEKNIEATRMMNDSLALREQINEREQNVRLQEEALALKDKMLYLREQEIDKTQQALALREQILRSYHFLLLQYTQSLFDPKLGQQVQEIAMRDNDLLAFQAPNCMGSPILSPSQQSAESNLASGLPFTVFGQGQATVPGPLIPKHENGALRNNSEDRTTFTRRRQYNF